MTDEWTCVSGRTDGCRIYTLKEYNYISSVVFTLLWEQIDKEISKGFSGFIFEGNFENPSNFWPIVFWIPSKNLKT